MYQMMDFKTVFTVFEVFSVDYRLKNTVFSISLLLGAIIIFCLRVKRHQSVMTVVRLCMGAARPLTNKSDETTPTQISSCKTVENLRINPLNQQLYQYIL